MNYYFDQFRFDAIRLNLFLNEKKYPMRNKAAELLSVLLTDPEGIVSKDEIFKKVWPNQVVSEQAIFQNINELRRIFGSGAIKTFIKKGYQWQVPVVTEAAISHVAPSGNNVSSDDGDDTSSIAKIYTMISSVV